MTYNSRDNCNIKIAKSCNKNYLHIKIYLFSIYRKMVSEMLESLCILICFSDKCPTGNKKSVKFGKSLHHETTAALG